MSGALSLAALLAAAAVLVTLSMLFSISESSFLSMNKLRLRVRRKKKDRRAERAGRLLEKKETLINTLLVSNDLVNILLSSIVTAAALQIFGEKGVGVATAVVTVLLLVFGEITPKTLSTRNPDAIAYALSLFVSAVVKIMRPFVLIFTAVSRIVLRLFGISVAKPRQSYTEEDIKSFIEAGGETGVLEKGEKKMMNRVFQFTDLDARNIMTPRTSIVAVPFGADYDTVIATARRTGFSRLPVYKKNIDDIVGVLYLKDLLKFRGQGASFVMRDAMRPPLFIPGTRKMSSIQQMLQENGQSLAVVIDEYSGTDGLLTNEDIYREIFGTSGESEIESAPAGSGSGGAAGNGGGGESGSGAPLSADRRSFTLDGTVLLLDLKDLIGVRLESDINETVGGWIVERLGHMPAAGDSVEAEGFRFTVTSAQSRRAARVRIERLDGENPL